MADLRVQALAGIGQALRSSRSKRTRQPVQPDREYRTFTTKAAITAAMEGAIRDAKVDDPTLIRAYHRIVGGGLLRQREGEQPWTFGNQTGVGREIALRLELAGLIKTGRKGSCVARLFFMDAGNVRKVKNNEIDEMVEWLGVSDDDEATGTDGE